MGGLLTPPTTLGERERSTPVHLQRTAHAPRWGGRRRHNRPPTLLGVQFLLLPPLLLKPVLLASFGVGGYEGISFGEDADTTVVMSMTNPCQMMKFANTMQ